MALDLASDSPDRNALRQRSLVVLSWNVWIGRGRLREVVTRIRKETMPRWAPSRNIPLVVLAQEAYRSDDRCHHRRPGRAGRVLMAQLGPRKMW